jgi:hypothetical protein
VAVQVAVAVHTAQVQRLVQAPPVKETMAAAHSLTVVPVAVAVVLVVQVVQDRDPSAETLATVCPTASLAQRLSTQVVV